MSRFVTQVEIKPAPSTVAVTVPWLAWWQVPPLPLPFPLDPEPDPLDPDGEVEPHAASNATSPIATNTCGTRI
jgi:hypothetical protein